jgi:hypothetical protein
MRKGYLSAIIGFALSRQTVREKVTYLIRGIVFAPWLARSVTGRSSREQGAATNSQVGDDIYPLF